MVGVDSMVYGFGGYEGGGGVIWYGSVVRELKGDCIGVMGYDGGVGCGVLWCVLDWELGSYVGRFGGG